MDEFKIVYENLDLIERNLKNKDKEICRVQEETDRYKTILLEFLKSKIGQKIYWAHKNWRKYETHLSKEEAQVKEKNLINKYKSNIPEFGYNISSGGEARTGVKLSEDAKKKISEANKGRLAGEKILYMEFVVMEKITRFMGGHIRKTQKKKSEINALELTWQKKQSKKLAMQQKVKIILDMGK